jgi:hypothetical protein
MQNTGRNEAVPEMKRSIKQSPHSFSCDKPCERKHKRKKRTHTLSDPSRHISEENATNLLNRMIRVLNDGFGADAEAVVAAVWFDDGRIA